MREIKVENKFDVSSGITVVKFGAEWCAPCKKLAVYLDKLENEFINYKFISVDIDNIPNLAKQYQIRSLPTIIIFKNGNKEKTIVGLPLIDSLRKTLREYSSVVKSTAVDTVQAIL